MDAARAQASSSKKRARAAENERAANADSADPPSDEDRSELGEEDIGDFSGDEAEHNHEASGSEAGPSSRSAKARTSDAGSSSAPVKKKKKKVLTPGIVYISRVPPGMTPQKVRHLMARWGEVGKVYAQRRDGQSPRS